MIVADGLMGTSCLGTSVTHMVTCEYIPEESLLYIEDRSRVTAMCIVLV